MPTRLLVLATLVVAVIAVGVASAWDRPSSSSDGGSYIVHRPPSLSRNRVAPLVVVNSGAKFDDLITMTGFNAEADKYGFLVAYVAVSRTYNDQSRQTNGSGEPYPDLKYIRQAVTEIRAAENADPSRIYLTGFSGGGVLAQRAACLLADQFAAVGPVGARLVLPDCVPPRPVSMFVIYGTSDPSVTTDIVRGDVSHWRTVDGCPDSVATSTSGAATIETWSACRNGTAVSVATVAGAAHAWPQSPKFGATHALWTFFAAHPMAAGAPSGKVLSVRAVGTGTKRSVLVRLQANEALSVKVRLLRKTRVIVAGSYRVQPGQPSLKLRVLRNTAPGPYRVEVTLRSIAGGGTRTIVRKLQLPR